MNIYHLNMDRPSLALHNTRALSTSGADEGGEEKLREVCEQFEAFLTAEMLKTMRTNTQSEGFLDKGRAEEVFTEQHDRELSKHLARRGALGIAQLLYDELKPQLELQVDNTENKAA